MSIKHSTTIKQLRDLSYQAEPTIPLLLGRSGILPSRYTEELITQLENNDTQLFHFYSILDRKILKLKQSINKLVGDFRPNIYEPDKEFFYYISLYAANLRSKQMLKQWLSSYFQLNCHHISITPLSINYTRLNVQNYRLGTNSRLGTVLKTNTGQINFYFKELEILHYQQLVANPMFLIKLQMIIQFVLSASAVFKLHFEIHSNTSFQSKFTQPFYLGVNSFLGEVVQQSKLTLAWNVSN